MKNTLAICLMFIVMVCLSTSARSQNCTLPVNGGTLSAAQTNVCAFAFISISVSGGSSGTGLTYQWESSPDNNSWSTMTGFTSPNLNTNQEESTWYRRKTTCDAGGFAYSNTVRITVKDFNTCYCTPNTSNCTTYRITNVNFGSINNPSDCGTNGYSNFSATVAAASIMQGSYLPISVTASNASTGRFVYCYIDYNQNGAFDPKEATMIFPPTGNVYNGFIKVPFHAKTGLTRMRILYSGGNNNTCFPDPNGEVEDYAINITQNTSPATGHVIYVKTTAPGSNSSGMSWTNARTSLRNALAIATAGDTIKMAAGTYYSGSSQSNGTVLQDSVIIMGGYPSGGSPTNADRNHPIHKTILSGFPNSSGSTNSADYHVLFASKIKNCTIDGLLIQNGGNNFGTGSQEKGGGIYMENSSSLIIRNTVFRDNNIYTKGSAFSVLNSSASFENCIVTKSEGYYSNMLVENSQVNFINLLVASNKGGYIMETDASSIVFKNSTIAANYLHGGIIWAMNQSQLSFINTISYYNSVYNNSWQSTSFDSSEVRLQNSTALFQHSLTQVAKIGSNLVRGISPKFKDTSNVAGPDGFYFTSDDGFQLSNPCSPALNAGSNTEATGIAQDITGSSRIFGASVDIGAYEVQQVVGAVPNVIYVNAAATGANNGSSWANAYTDLHKALAACSDTIKIAAGTYQPWKSNFNSNFYWFENKRIILGAYPPNGNPSDADRNYELYQTKIDGGTLTGETAANIVRGLGLDSTSRIDGLIFTNTGVQNWFSDGAVVYAECNNPVISNCEFTGNKRRVFWGKNNKNPLFLNTKVYGNTTYGNSYGLDLVVLTNSEQTTFRYCTFNNNLLPTGTSTSGEFGKILLLENTDAIIDSCSFSRNKGTVMVNVLSDPSVKASKFFRNYAGDRTTDLFNRYSNPKFSNCEFTDSTATAAYGGVMNNFLSDPEFTNCKFTNARTSYRGGVAYNDSSRAKFKNCVFLTSINSFYNVNGSHIELSNCISTESSFYYSAPAFMYNFRSSPVITNTSVVNGTASSIGLIVNENESHPVISNSIFWKNFNNTNVDPSQLSDRIEIKNIGNSQPLIQNSMFDLYDAGQAGNNTKDIDPRFKNYLNAIGPDSLWFTADDGLQLCDCSPAINSGLNAVSQDPQDLAGLPRVFNNTVDRGAYELQSLPATTSNTVYVKSGTGAGGNGLSWNGAYANLHSALQDPCADTVKIAAGIYKPALQARDSGYYINRDLVILGSYDINSGNRDVDVYPTILSGDVGIAGDTSDNSFGLMNAFYADSLFIDGIVFRDVNMNMSVAQKFRQALDAEYLQYLSLSNNRFYDNYSNSYGSAVFIMQVKNFDLSKNVFSGNKAINGAGLYYDYTGSGSRVRDCVFEKNEASHQGGGIYAGESGVSFINCLFTGNKAMQGGAMLVDNNRDVMVTNCTFADNLLINGGSAGAGIYSSAYTFQGGGAGPFIGNCIFTNNTTQNMAGQGQGTYHDIYYPKNGYPPIGGNVELRIHHSAVSTYPIYYYGGGLIAPSTIQYKNHSNPIGPDGKWFTADDGLQLSLCSQGIDVGSNTPVVTDKDLAGNTRIIKNIVDLGAYEVTGHPVWSQLLNTSNDSLTANKEITDSTGWTHYYKDCKYLMSIKKAGQNIGTVGDGSFELKVVTAAGYNSGTAMNLTAATYNTTGQPWYVMHRYWKVNATNAVQDSIRVRFPYTNGDYNDVIGSNLSVSQHQQLEFFKVSGTHNPFDLNVTPSNFFRYSHADEPSSSRWSYSQQDSIHLADYFVQSFSGGGGGAWFNASLPDLSIISQTITPSVVPAGGTVMANFTGVNLSNTFHAGAHRISIYISSDDSLTIGANGDSLVGIKDIPGLNASSNTGLLNQPISLSCSIAPGNYFVFFVSDALKSVTEINEYNNIVSSQFTITSANTISTPVILASPGGAICNGNSVTLTASAASCISCTYSWSNGNTGNSVTVNSAGVYTVTASNGCSSASASFTVVVNQAPIVNISSSAAIICEGNNVVFTATGADSYTWSGNGLQANIGNSVSAVPVSSGVYLYTVTGTTNGCSTSNTISLTVKPKPVIFVSPADTSICLGNSVSMNATGAATYSWSPATSLNTTIGPSVISTPVTTTTYILTGTTDGCSSVITRTITVMPIVTPAVNIQVSGCPGNNLTFTANPVNGGSSPSYQWYVNNVASGTGNSLALNNVVNGTAVYVNMISNANCTSQPSVNSSTTTVNCITTSIPPVDGLESFSISPNPSSGWFAIHIKLKRLKAVSISITNSDGRIVYQTNKMNIIGEERIRVNLTNQAQGVYFVKTNIGSESFVEKIIVAR